MKKYLQILLLFATMFGQAQTDTIADTKYLEDQFYLGITYNTLNDLPADISSRGFSNGIFIGYIKDIPINEERNFGFGLGLGYGRNTFFQNLKISEVSGNTVFETIQGDFNRNKFSLHGVEFPLEIRWRTSTPTRYKFWRVYSGIKFSYIFTSNAELDQNGITSIININEVNKFQYGLTLAVGYGTWNINFYYGLRDVFSDAQMNTTNEPVGLRDVRIGLIFYIL